MMKVKANYKGATNDLKCRWCQSNLETPKTYSANLPLFYKITNKTPCETNFMNDKTATSTTLQILHNVHPIVHGDHSIKTLSVFNGMLGTVTDAIRV